MSETNKNKIYFNDDENAIADILTDMKKMAQSIDDSIEKSKYNDNDIKEEITNVKKNDKFQNSNITYLEEKTKNIESRQIDGHDEIINILNLKNSFADIAMLSNSNAYTTRGGFTTTNFIKVNTGDRIFVDYKMPINLFSFVCFDKDKNIVNKLKTATDWTKYGIYIVEEDVAYIKFTIQTTQIGVYGVYLNAEESPSNFIEYGKSHLNWLKINENNIDNNSVIEEKLDEKLQKKIARAKQIEKQIPTAETEIAETVILSDSADLGAEVSVFGNLKQEIREGYNLINLGNLPIVEKNGLTYVATNNVLYLNGTVTATTEIIIPIKETILNGSYVHQIFANFTPTANINNNFKVSQGTTGIGNINLKSAKKVKFSVNDDTNIAFLYLQILPQTIKDGQIKYQLVSGTEEKEFEEYGKAPSLEYSSEIETVKNNVKITQNNKEYILPIQKELAKIGEYRDSFIKKENKWYEKHYIKKAFFDGTEDGWSVYTQGNMSNYYNNSLLYFKTQEGISNYFEVSNDISYSNTNTRLVIFNTKSGFGIYTEKSTFESLEAFKNKLSEWNEAGNPLSLYYVLENPEDIECTDEQSEILEQLQNIETDKGTNIITTDTIAEVKAKYYKDLETLFKKAGVL